MKKYIFGLILMMFFLISPKPAEALYRDVGGSNNFTEYYFAINASNDEPNPPEFVKDTSNINVNITAWKDGEQKPIFTVGDNYDILFTNTGTGRKCSRAVGYSTTNTIANNQDVNALNFSIIPKHIVCDLEPGTWSVSVWSSRDDKPWFTLGDFPINSPGGGSSAKMVAVSNPNLICKDKVTEVRIENAEEGKIFNLYWKGDLKNYAYRDRAPGRSFTAELTGGDGSLKVGSKPTLCLIEGDVNFVPGLQGACTNSLEFDYTADESKCAANNQLSCKAVEDSLEIGTAKKQAKISGTNFPTTSKEYRGDLFNKTNTAAEPKRFNNLPVSTSGSVSVNTGELAPGDYIFNFYAQDGVEAICPVPIEFKITDKVDDGNGENTTPIDFKKIVCDPGKEGSDNRCANSSGEYCDADRKLLKTAIGCVPVDPGLFIAGLMKYITGFSGGIALLMMVFGAFQMMTSGGNADSLKKGREQFVSAVIGLLFVIFSVLLLQIIGVDLLGLPGFTK